MSLTEPSPGQILALRGREKTTEAMIRQIDGKIARLDAARASRILALNNIRRELVRSLQTEPVAPDDRDAA